MHKIGPYIYFIFRSNRVKLKLLLSHTFGSLVSCLSVMCVSCCSQLNVKQYVDEAIDSALDKKDIPVVVKFIFSVLEELASSLGVDQETLLSWKNNW